MVSSALANMAPVRGISFARSAAAVALAALIGCSPATSTAEPPPTPPTGPADYPAMPAEHVTGPFPVAKVSDGDTIWVDNNGAREKVRLIGMDTPELHDPRTPVECFAQEASNQAELLLDGQSVFLESDPTQDSVDRYGRTLAYAWTESGRLFNLDMIHDGFANEYTYDTPYRYQDRFRAAEADARNHERGLWLPATCGGQA